MGGGGIGVFRSSCLRPAVDIYSSLEKRKRKGEQRRRGCETSRYLREGGGTCCGKRIIDTGESRRG